MSNSAAVHVDEHDEAGTLDPQGFAAEIRRLAMDTHQALKHPETVVDELVSVKRRYEFMLNQNPEPCASSINRWLRSGLQMLLAKLQTEDAPAAPIHQGPHMRSVKRAELRGGHMKTSTGCKNQV